MSFTRSHQSPAATNTDRGLPDRYVWWAGVCQTGTYDGQGFAKQVRMIGRDMPDRYVSYMVGRGLPDRYV